MLTNIRKMEKRVLKNDNSKYKRHLLETIDFTAPIVGIVGARGVGKATLLIQYANLLKKIYEPYKSLYFSYDYAVNIDVKLFDLAGELNKIGTEYLIIDKIHKFINFEEDLQSIREVYPQLKIIFSASSVVNTENFSDKISIYHMKGLSYREFLELKLDIELPSFSLNEILNDSVYIVNKLEDKFTPLEYFNEYLSTGYYPFYFNENSNYIRELNDVINQTIDIDLLEKGLVKVNFIDKLKKLLVLVSQTNPSSLNITKLSSAMNVSRNTIYAYLRHLEIGGLLNTLSSKKSVSKLAKAEKLYLKNTNISYALAIEDKIESIRETFFVSQLKEDFSLRLNSDGDFILDDKYILQIGIKSRDLKQTSIENSQNSYLVIDTDSTEDKFKIPLWLFGFLY
jgi:predicted AAA+ superfamily ATPase